MRVFLSSVLALLVMNTATAQVVFKGPDKVKPGTMQIVTIDEAKGDDFKIEAFRDGKSTKENWQVFKNLEDKFVILLLPAKESSKGAGDGDEGHTYTFVAAISNKVADKQKTFLATHEVSVEGTVVPPIPVDPEDDKKPKPKPKPTGFREKLTAAYQAAPNKDALNKYQLAWEELNKQKFKKYGDFETALVATTAKFLKQDDIKGVRAEVANYLLETLKDDPRVMDMSKAQDAINEVIAALKTL